MKKTIKLTALILSILCILLLAACGKGEDTPKIITIGEREEKLGISYDNIVCMLRLGPGTPFEVHEDFYTNITVYGNNTVQLWTGDYIDGKMSVFQADEPVAITEEQKQKLIKAIRSSTIEIIPDDYDDGIMDGGSLSMYLYDADGNSVDYDELEGDPRTDVNFREVKDILFNEFTTYEERRDIEERTYGVYLKFGMGADFEGKICTVYEEIMSDSIWIAYTVYDDNRIEVKGFISPYAGEDLLADMEPIVIEISEEDTEKIKKCILTEMRDEYMVENPWKYSDFLDDEDNLSYNDCAVQYYSGDYECYYSTELENINLIYGVLFYDVLDIGVNIRCAGQICEIYQGKLGRNISFDDVLCHYTFEPYTKNKNGERIAVKFTVSAETADLKVSIGPVSDVKGERDIVSKEYTPEEYWAWALWSHYNRIVNNYEMNESQPNYKKVGAHTSYFDRDGNFVGYISGSSEESAQDLKYIEECVLSDSLVNSEMMKNDIENMKAEAEKLMQ